MIKDLVGKCLSPTLWYIWYQTRFIKMPVQQTVSEVEPLLPLVKKKKCSDKMTAREIPLYSQPSGLSSHYQRGFLLQQMGANTEIFSQTLFREASQL